MPFYNDVCKTDLYLDVRSQTTPVTSSGPTLLEMTDRSSPVDWESILETQPAFFFVYGLLAVFLLIIILLSTTACVQSRNGAAVEQTYSAVQSSEPLYAKIFKVESNEIN